MKKIVDINRYRASKKAASGHFLKNKLTSFFIFYNSKKNLKKMLFITILLGLFIGLSLWKIFVENIAINDVKIPPSANLKFNNTAPLAMNNAQIVAEFESFDNKPILLYLYTSWCGTCTKNFATINEIAREFQNTDLNIIALAIDRGIDETKLQDYLNQFGDVYFQPRFLINKNGFVEFLRQKDIKYSGNIPFTVLFSADGKAVTKFIGIKNKNYLRNKIITELYPN